MSTVRTTTTTTTNDTTEKNSSYQCFFSTFNLANNKVSSSNHHHNSSNKNYSNSNSNINQTQHQLQQAKDEVENILVKGMNRLSFDELQVEQEDLHGVAGCDIEKNGMINKLLDALELHLQELKQQQQQQQQGTTTAYATAESTNQEYVTDRGLRITFLRANRYCPLASAEQMIRHFAMKQHLFGSDKLGKDITLADLEEDDIECILAGGYQISNVKDRSGRTILLEYPGLSATNNNNNNNKSIQNNMRARFYVTMQLIKSNNTANRCVVVIRYGIGETFGGIQNNNHNNHNSIGAGIMREYTKLTMAMPFRIAGIHLCFDDQRSALMAKAAITITSPKMKAKMKVHFGSDMECQYLLATFGIPRNALPPSVEDKGPILKRQQCWYNDCVQEELAASKAITEKPANDNDVFCLGRKVNNSGSERLRQMAAQHADWYKNGNSNERKVLVDLMVQDIRKKGGRFLKPNDCGGGGGGLDWQEVSPCEARVKVHQMFRNYLKKLKRPAAQTTNVNLQVPETMVNEPGENDIVFGRAYDHVGNQRLRKLVGYMACEFNAATRGKKKEIASSVVEIVKSRGGRFLKPIEQKWIEASNKEAISKVSIQFRNVRRKAIEEG